MIWIAAMVMAAFLVKLGMLMVMVKILTIGMSVAILVSIVFAIAMCWRFFRKPFTRRSPDYF